MKLQDLVNKLSLNVLSHNEGLERIISGGYVSDMLSDVLAHSQEGNIWITIQTHPNIVAVAKLKNLVGVLIASEKSPEEETLKKAVVEKITIMTTPLSTFEAAGKVYQLLQDEHK
jgi:predicted transcriptional regulator